MDQSISNDLERLGREAAEQIAGAGSVEQVEVTSGHDYEDRPIYVFSFLIDQAKAAESLGFVRIRLGQKLRDKLAESGDPHYPMIRLLDRTDWAKRASA